MTPGHALRQHEPRLADRERPDLKVQTPCAAPEYVALAASPPPGSAKTARGDLVEPDKELDLHRNWHAWDPNSRRAKVKTRPRSLLPRPLERTPTYKIKLLAELGRLSTARFV